MSVSAGDVFAAYVIGDIFGQRTMLTLGYKITAVGSAVSEAAAAVQIAFNLSGQVGSTVNLESPLRAVLPPDWELISIRAQRVRPIRMALQELILGVNGTHASSTEATNQAAVITMRSQLAGRKYVSNKHIGPLPQGATVQTNGLLTPAYKALLQDVADKLNLVMVDVPLGMTAEPGIINADLGVNFTKFTVGIPQDTIRVMRRRTVRVGE